MTDQPPLKIKIQLFCGDEIAMGPGKADLLDLIREGGSISAGGRALGMSYRRAWLLVDAMNRCWREPLVATHPGSSQGRGATVTPFGEDVLRHYRTLQGRLAGSSNCADYGALTKAMLSEPRAAQSQ